MIPDRVPASSVRWGVKSLAGLALNLGLLTVWVDGLGWPAELALLVNWLLLSVVGYVLADRWVYADGTSPDSLRGVCRRYLGLQSVMASGKVVNYALYVGLLWLGVEYHLAWVFGAVVTFAWSWAGSRTLWHGLPDTT